MQFQRWESRILKSCYYISRNNCVVDHSYKYLTINVICISIRNENMKSNTIDMYRSVNHFGPESQHESRFIQLNLSTSESYWIQRYRFCGVQPKNRQVEYLSAPISMRDAKVAFFLTGTNATNALMQLFYPTQWFAHYLLLCSSLFFFSLYLFYLQMTYFYKSCIIQFIKRFDLQLGK